MCASFVCFTHGINGFLFQSAFSFPILLKNEVPFLLSSLTKRIKTMSVSLFSLCEQHSHPTKHLIAFYKYDFSEGPDLKLTFIVLSSSCNTAGGVLQGDF